MKKLQSTFNLHKYGLLVRLVTEEDAPYILSLRTNAELSKHIHSTSTNIEIQLAWIKEYKKREKKGQEYYFIYEKGDKPIGVNRLSDIKGSTGITGSAICPKTNSPIDTLSTIILLYDIVFEVLELDNVTFATDNDNTHALKINYALGAEIISDDGKEKLFILRKEKYYLIKNKLIRIWRLKV